MSFVLEQDHEGFSAIITAMSWAELTDLKYLLDSELHMINYPILFESRKGYGYVTVLLQASLNCPPDKWQKICSYYFEERYPGRVIYPVDWYEKEETS